MNKGLKGAEVGRYVSENNLSTISLEEQKRLFEISYLRAELGAERSFPGLASYPSAVQEALVDMVFQEGENQTAVREELKAAVAAGKWEEAAGLSKRRGAGVERNQAIGQLLKSAGKRSEGESRR